MIFDSEGPGKGKGQPQSPKVSRFLTGSLSMILTGQYAGLQGYPRQVQVTRSRFSIRKWFPDMVDQRSLGSQVHQGLERAILKARESIDPPGGILSAVRDLVVNLGSVEGHSP